MADLFRCLLLKASLFLQWLEYIRLKFFLVNPASIQKQVLNRILSQNRSTGFGLAHHFPSISSYEEFSEQIPVRTSAAYAPYLAECFNGNFQSICSEEPVFFAMTAGSTGDYKYIPVTKSLIRETRKTILCFYHLLNQLCPETKQSPIQFIVGSGEGGLSPGGIPKGFMSGFNYKHLPAVIRSKFVIPYWVFTLENAQDRYYAMARFLVAEPKLAAIGAFSPLNISNVIKYAIQDMNRLLADIGQGTLTLVSSSVPANASFKPDQGLALKLRQYCDKPVSPDDLHAISRLLFPALKYAVCWQGGNMGFVTREMKEYFPNIHILEMPFSASEGVFAIPYQLDQSGGIAAITSHFLEFIPEQEISAKPLKALPVWRIEQGQYYYLVITTIGGLYRYNMEDLVYVKGFEGRTPVIEFVSKMQRQVSVANERLTEHDVVTAIVNSANITGQTPGDFLMLPSYDKHYILMYENTMQDHQAFADIFEQQLCQLSKGYGFEREDRLLNPLVVAQVKVGEIERLARPQRQENNLPNAQIKPLHLSNDFGLHKQYHVIRQVAARDA